MKRVLATSTQVSAMDLPMAANSFLIKYISFSVNLACFILACQSISGWIKPQNQVMQQRGIDGVNITGRL